LKKGSMNRRVCIDSRLFDGLRAQILVQTKTRYFGSLIAWDANSDFEMKNKKKAMDRWPQYLI
jgi:hypothetical protein